MNIFLHEFQYKEGLVDFIEYKATDAKRER